MGTFQEIWGEDWDSDDDCSPPVPEKTREAYMLPPITSEEKKSSSQSLHSNSSEKLPGTGNRTFSKFGILSKLGLKTESKGAGNISPEIKSQSPASSLLSPEELVFPKRLVKKPKGPRSIPPTWAHRRTDVQL